MNAEFNNEFAIPRSALNDFLAAIKKMNRKATKFGCEPVRVEVVGERVVTKTRTTKLEGEQYVSSFQVAATIVRVTGNAPTVGNYSFLARVEYLSDAKSILFHAMPGASTKVDERFRALRPSTCEHCNKVRSRRDTFVVLHNETGEQKQVGRQCLADFVGSLTPQQIAGKAASLNDLVNLNERADEFWRSYIVNTISTDDILRLASAYIELFGWTSKATAAEQNRDSTAYRVGRHFSDAKLEPYEKKEMRRASDLLKASDVHAKRAADVAAWVRGDLTAKQNRGDYETNLVTLFAGDVAEPRHIGLIASAVPTYQRAMNQKVEYARRVEENANSKHIGEVKERLRNLSVRVEFVRAMESDWGASTLIKFRDDAGNVLTWFASGDRNFTVGERLTIDGTVKRHSDYKGVKETALSRVREKEAVAA